MENNEFEKVETKKKKKNRGIVKSHKKNKLAKVATVLLIASLISIFAGCTSSCNPDKDDPSIDDPSIDDPGIITPVPDPDDPENPNEPSDPEKPDEPDDPVIDPDDPVIDPDDPVIDPDDPVIDPDPSDPTDPGDPENPGNPEIPSDEDIPDSIDKVDEVDEINYFADEFTKILNKNYLNDLAKQFIGRNGTADDIDSTEWYITNSNGKDQIKELQVKVYYDTDTTRYFKVGKVTFNQAYSVQDIIKGNATYATCSVAYRDSEIALKDIENNTALGKTIIRTIDANNDLKGDIWCSIGGSIASNGSYVTQVTVYQISSNTVTKYQLSIRTPNATQNPDILLANITNNSSPNKNIEYTFAGEKIEQTNEYSQNLANYNYDFDDDIALC